MEEQLQELLDKRACEEVLLRYGRTLDWLDEAGQAACFWPDAAIDYGFFEGDGAGWPPVAMQTELACDKRWHVCTGALVEVKGHQARAESYGLTMGAVTDDTGQQIATLFGGRYLDELEKRDGEWRISKRCYIGDWAKQFPDELGAITENGLALNILDITAPGHDHYRNL